MHDICIIGELNLDFIITGVPEMPRLGEELIVKDMLLTLGSSSAILACQLAKLGSNVLFISKVGGDAFGQRALEFLQKKRVRTDHITVLPKLPSGLTIAISVGSERAMLTQLGTINEMRARDINWNLVQQCRHVHISSYYLQQSLRPDIANIFAKAQALGKTTSFDTGWPSGEEAYLDDLDKVWPHVDVFLPNDAEVKRLSEKTNIAAAMRAFGEMIPTVVVKRGPKGSLALQDKQVIRSPGLTIQVIDTTGAGDSFNGGFLYGYLNKWPLSKCLALGNATGALSTRGPGGTTTQADLKEAQRFLRTATRRK